MALHTEAKPIIDMFRLKKITHVNLPFSIFVNKDKTIHLIISGIGKIKMAAATTFLFMWTGSQKHSCFLNIGIAGSNQFSIGEGMLIHKMTEMSTGKSYYPFVSFLKIKKQAHLITYDTPQNSYPNLSIIDMEGSAFFETATQFVSLEQVQLFKIISDIDEKSLQALTKEKVTQIISDNLSTISELANSLIELSIQENKLDPTLDLIKEFQSTWYFTHAQLIQLKEVLRRWHTQKKNINAWQYCQNEKNAAYVISKLFATVNESF